MYRIRFHGRGGQGMKTASRILGTAFFLEGFEVQDAPRYGAERRGAPIFAYVRVSNHTINERGIIHVPDLVIVADGTLLSMPAAQVTAGCSHLCILLPESSESAHDLQNRLNFKGTFLTISRNSFCDANGISSEFSSFWAGAAARLCSGITISALKKAVSFELGPLGESAVEKGEALAVKGWEVMADHAGIVNTSETLPPLQDAPPEWVTLQSDPVMISAPAVRTTSTSVHVKTGLWRTKRPVTDHTVCKKCWWNCSVYCPDSVISINSDGHPDINYDHCKGCLICAFECKSGAISIVNEDEAVIS